jgi:hypothetical protein
VHLPKPLLLFRFEDHFVPMRARFHEDGAANNTGSATDRLDVGQLDVIRIETDLVANDSIMPAGSIASNVRANASK